VYNDDGEEITYDWMIFSGGEIRVKIHDDFVEKYSLGGIGGEAVNIRIEAYIMNSDDLMTLIMLTDALKNELWVRKYRLTLPYIPYARQDRVCNPGEAFSLNVFAGLINDLGFHSVVVYDAHSNVAVEAIHRVINEPQYELLRKHDGAYTWLSRSIWSGVPTYLVCPDKGAVKKSEEILKHFSFHGIIYAEKVRDPATGMITHTEVKNPPKDIKGANLLICDDICDGGRTFIELGNVLQKFNPKSINLYVTHGIFSKGKDVLLKSGSGVFNNIWSTVDFADYK